MRTILLAAMVLTGILLVACGDDDEDGGSAGGEVDVVLQEFAVLPEVDSVDAGEVTFNVENKGPDDIHEFVVLKTELDADALPTVADGSVDEEGEGIEVVVDEIEDLLVGETQSLTVDLAAGSYVLLCNIYDKAEDEAHYQEGMRTGFTVE